MWSLNVTFGLQVALFYNCVNTDNCQWAILRGLRGETSPRWFLDLGFRRRFPGLRISHIPPITVGGLLSLRRNLGAVLLYIYVCTVHEPWEMPVTLSSK